ncbi:hypothetical protein EVAR_25543_1 [Eumeta japonica]|uniref:Uncharacterized protein n=1 Tax=Eumeta variegata TaxID=151549 RepID=A0A4C1Z5H0_EUMVA|nr:hypothetical protein EVAR_25543_1 [Eumeta japonica]
MKAETYGSTSELRSLKYSDLATLSVKFRLRWRRTRTAAQAAPGRLLRHGARTFPLDLLEEMCARLVGRGPELRLREVRPPGVSARCGRLGRGRSAPHASAFIRKNRIVLESSKYYNTIKLRSLVFAPSRRRVLCLVLAPCRHPAASRDLSSHERHVYGVCTLCSTCPLERTGGRWPGRSGSSAVGARDAVWASSLSESRSFALWAVLGTNRLVSDVMVPTKMVDSTGHSKAFRQIETLARRWRSHPAVSRGGCVAFTGCVSAPPAHGADLRVVAYGPSMRRASACGADGPGSRPPLLGTWQEYDYEHAKDVRNNVLIIRCRVSRGAARAQAGGRAACKQTTDRVPEVDHDLLHGEYYSAFRTTRIRVRLATGVYHSSARPTTGRARLARKVRQRWTSEDALGWLLDPRTPAGYPSSICRCTTSRFPESRCAVFGENVAQMMDPGVDPGVSRRYAEAVFERLQSRLAERRRCRCLCCVTSTAMHTNLSGTQVLNLDDYSAERGRVCSTAPALPTSLIRPHAIPAMTPMKLSVFGIGLTRVLLRQRHQQVRRPG